MRGDGRAIVVNNGLRQGCCMAPVFFNLSTCAMMERWLERASSEEEEIRIRLRYKYDGKLFRWYTRNADMGILTECLFADDSALVSSSRPSHTLVTARMNNWKSRYSSQMSI